MLQKKEGDYANAKINYERALKIVSEKLGLQHPKIGIYSVNLGDIYRKLGDWAEAETAYVPIFFFFFSNAERLLQVRARSPDS